MTKPTIDPPTFDMMVRPAKPEQLWGLPAIGAALGVSSDTVGRWLKNQDGIPVSRCGGRWFALRSELEAWRAGR